MGKDCEHGVGHSNGIHTCDGCCILEEETLGIRIRNELFKLSSELNCKWIDEDGKTWNLVNNGDFSVGLTKFIRSEIKSALEATRLSQLPTRSLTSDGFNAALAEQKRKIEEYLKSLEV